MKNGVTYQRLPCVPARPRSPGPRQHRHELRRGREPQERDGNERAEEDRDDPPDATQLLHLLRGAHHEEGRRGRPTDVVRVDGDADGGGDGGRQTESEAVPGGHCRRQKLRPQCGIGIRRPLGIQQRDGVGKHRPGEDDETEAERFGRIGVAQPDGGHGRAEGHGHESEGATTGQQRRAERHRKDADDRGDRRVDQEGAEQDGEGEEHTDRDQAQAGSPLRGEADDGGGKDADGPGQAPARIAGEDDQGGREGAEPAAERIRPSPGQGAGWF